MQYKGKHSYIYIYKKLRSESRHYSVKLGQTLHFLDGNVCTTANQFSEKKIIKGIKEKIILAKNAFETTFCCVFLKLHVYIWYVSLNLRWNFPTLKTDQELYMFVEILTPLQGWYYHKNLHKKRDCHSKIKSQNVSQMIAWQHATLKITRQVFMSTSMKRISNIIITSKNQYS